MALLRKTRTGAMVFLLGAFIGCADERTSDTDSHGSEGPSDASACNVGHEPINGKLLNGLSGALDAGAPTIEGLLVAARFVDRLLTSGA